jgi:hypothetical protein
MGNNHLENVSLEGSLVRQLILTEMWCDDRMFKGRLLCAVLHLHLHDVTVFLTFQHRLILLFVH